MLVQKYLDAALCFSLEGSDPNGRRGLGFLTNPPDSWLVVGTGLPSRLIGPEEPPPSRFSVQRSVCLGRFYRYDSFTFVVLM